VVPVLKELQASYGLIEEKKMPKDNGRQNKVSDR
jgi:hypothetical protein